LEEKVVMLTANLSTCHFGSTDDLLINFRDSGGNSKYYQITNRKFKDINAWYHFHYIVDGDNSTQGDRSRLYINGVRETSFALNNNPSSNSYEIATFLSSDGAFTVGRALRSQTNTFGNFDGLISNFNCSTGYVYEPTVFGEVDTTTGQWKIINNPTFTPGTDGFTILKDGNTITDQSANSNNFSLTAGTLTNSLDCPDNVFATLNPLDKGYTGTINLANGNNTTMASSGAGDYGLRSTLGASSGKYYFEVKVNGGNTQSIGDMDARLVINMQDSSPTAGFYGFQRYSNSATNLYNNGSFVSQNTAMWGGITAGDIISFAVDLDNSKIFLQKNGTGWKNTSGATGDPVNGTNPTFTIADATKTYGFYCELRDNADNQTQMNFGNGVFGTTAVTSAGTAGSTPGTFEYDVPSGYQPLSTKGLNA